MKRVVCLVAMSLGAGLLACASLGQQRPLGAPPTVSSTISVSGMQVTATMTIADPPQDLIGLIVYGKKNDPPSETDVVHSQNAPANPGSAWTTTSFDLYPDYQPGDHYEFIAEYLVGNRQEGVVAWRYEGTCAVPSTGNPCYLAPILTQIEFLTSEIIASPSAAVVRVGIGSQDKDSRIEKVEVFVGQGVPPLNELWTLDDQDPDFVIHPEQKRSGQRSISINSKSKVWVIAKVLARTGSVRHYWSIHGSDLRLPMKRVP